MLKRAREVIASGDEKAVVDYAVEANRSISRTTGELEEAKAFLRQAAQGRRLGDALSVELEGNLGVATVSFSRPEVKSRKGRDLRDIEVNLDPVVFSRLFSKQVLVAPLGDFEVKFAQLKPTDREIVEQFIEVRASTPKVHLTK